MDQKKFIWAGRADLILIDKTIFQWMRNKLAKQGVPVVADSELVYHPIFKGKTMFKVEFKDPQLRDAFNKELHKISANGTYDKIVAEAIK